MRAPLPRRDPPARLPPHPEAEHAARAATTPSVGVDPVELARRAHRQVRHGSLAPAALARWLVDSGFAVRRDGLLFATELGVEVGADLQALG